MNRFKNFKRRSSCKKEFWTFFLKMSNVESDFEAALKDVGAGCCRGMAQVFVGHPLDTIKVPFYLVPSVLIYSNSDSASNAEFFLSQIHWNLGLCFENLQEWRGMFPSIPKVILLAIGLLQRSSKSPLHGRHLQVFPIHITCIIFPYLVPSSSCRMDKQKGFFM